MGDTVIVTKDFETEFYVLLVATITAMIILAFFFHKLRSLMCLYCRVSWSHLLGSNVRMDAVLTLTYRSGEYSTVSVHMFGNPDIVSAERLATGQGQAFEMTSVSILA